MTARLLAVVAGMGAFVATLAAYLRPAWAGYHTWQYATGLVVAVLVLGAYAWPAARGRDGAAGAAYAVAALGAIVVGVAGLASGLLGPDTVSVARAPGTVAPLPDVGAAAFFPSVASSTIAAGDAAVTIRTRDRAETTVARGRDRIVGDTALGLVPQRAAFVEVRDVAGDRLTVTQPTNPAFLSPVLIFTTTVPIAGMQVPASSFAVPSLHRQVRALVIDPLAAAHVHALGDRPVVLFAVDDDEGRGVPGGIGFAASGHDVVLGGLRLRATLGEYPALELSSVPSPLGVALGVAITLAGLVVGVTRRTTSRARKV